MAISADLHYHIYADIVVGSEKVQKLDRNIGMVPHTDTILRRLIEYPSILM